VLRGISAMGLAAVTVPFSAAGAHATTTAPAPKPKPDSKQAPKGKPKPNGLVKDGNTPLATTDQIKENSGMLFETEEYIVTQPKKGKFVGFDSLCTHEGCPVDVFDKPGIMTCSCHNSDFAIDSGKPQSGPAKKPLPKKPIIVEGNKIYKAKKA
jgi:Rieske Fe-S protein